MLPRVTAPALWTASHKYLCGEDQWSAYLPPPPLLCHPSLSQPCLVSLSCILGLSPLSLALLLLSRSLFLSLSLFKLCFYNAVSPGHFICLPESQPLSGCYGYPPDVCVYIFNSSFTIESGVTGPPDYAHTLLSTGGWHLGRNIPLLYV